MSTAAKQTVVLGRHAILSGANAISAVGVALAYFFTARLSLVLLEPVDGVAVFWPAAGVASGILIALGSAARWTVVVGVMAATIAANLLGDRNIWSSAFFAVANAAEAVIVAGLIHRFCGSPFKLNELRRVLALFAATVIGTSLSGIAGTFGFVLFHGSAASPLVIWLHWFSSDAIGIIAVAPLAIGLASLARNFPPRGEIMEGVLALAVVSLVCALLVFLPNQPWTTELAIGGLCPLLLWIAARLRPAFTAIATFICAITIVWTTIFAIGFFGDLRLSVEQRVLEAQATILAISLGFLVLAALFSERRLHESAILEREARLLAALRAGSVVAFDWDVSADEVRFSQNATEILGFHPQQVLRGTEWLKHIHPEDHALAASCLDGARPDQPAQSIAFRCRRPDGGEVWLEQIAIVQFDSTGKPTRTSGLMTDVTERKRTETALRESEHSLRWIASVVESSDDAIISKNLDGIITSWNKGAERLFTYTAEEAIGHPITMIIPKDRLDEQSTILPRIRRGERIDHFETVRQRKDGSLVSISLTVSPMKNAEGKIVGASKIARDITEQKLAWKTAELADRAKSNFLAAASHDLRQPLQTLKLLQAALEPHQTSSEARKLVAGIGQSLDTMTSILSSLLDVNRLESGNLRPSVTEFSLNEIFEPLAGDFVAPVAEKGLRLHIVRSELVIRSDRRMLAEMIRNLLSNATRYTDRGRILLGCRRAGDNVRIEVWDSGVGITEDQLPHVFHEYYQGIGGAERGGFGLGLAIVKRLGGLLDHRIDVRSIPREGYAILH